MSMCAHDFVSYETGYQVCSRCGWSERIPPEPSSDRHPKWIKVEGEIEIPPGQPIRVERAERPDPSRELAVELVLSDSRSPEDFTGTVSLDSSWCPPLELPTEPTWGIAVTKYGGSTRLARWDGNGESVWVPAERYGRAGLLDFIPLTDEQAARIEAAR